MNQHQNDKFVTLSWICIHFFSIESFENFLFWSMATALLQLLPCQRYNQKDETITHIYNVVFGKNCDGLCIASNYFALYTKRIIIQDRSLIGCLCIFQMDCQKIIMSSWLKFTLFLCTHMYVLGQIVMTPASQSDVQGEYNFTSTSLSTSTTY